MKARDKGRWRVRTIVRKFRSGYSKPYETIVTKGNLLLNEGINEMLDLLIGAGGTTVFSNANARIGVGNGTTAAVATQTALQGASTAFKAMDATYPIRGSQKVTFRSTFVEADANFAWEEWTVDNGSTPNKNLNRKVENKGTKTSSEQWQITVEISIS